MTQQNKNLIAKITKWSIVILIFAGTLFGVFWGLATYTTPKEFQKPISFSNTYQIEANINKTSQSTISTEKIVRDLEDRLEWSGYLIQIKCNSLKMKKIVIPT